MSLFSLGGGHTQRNRWVSVAAAALFRTVAPTFALAQSDAITPVEEFSREIDQLKQTFTELGKKIDESARSMDALTDVATARREIEQLRGAVSTL